jgi:hypothetical protein
MKPSSSSLLPRIRPFTHQSRKGFVGLHSNVSPATANASRFWATRPTADPCTIRLGALNSARRHFYVTQSTEPLLCPSCSQPLPTRIPACNKCDYIASIPITNQAYQLYDILGVPSLPNPFVVDEKALVANFRRSQVACHPDSWASRGSVRLFPQYGFPSPTIRYRRNNPSHKTCLLK